MDYHSSIKTKLTEEPPISQKHKIKIIITASCMNLFSECIKLKVNPKIKIAMMIKNINTKALNCKPKKYDLLYENESRIIGTA